MHVKFWAQYRSTTFLALDKGIRPREFVEILQMPGNTGAITADAEWVALNDFTADTQFGVLYPL
jgi:hypothetical protein